MGKSSQSFTWANTPGRRTPMSPFKLRVSERVFGNWAWHQKTRCFEDSTAYRTTCHITFMPQVVLYANTRAEWMISAIGAFKHSLAIVTIYTNLGEDGVHHGITQVNSRPNDINHIFAISLSFTISLLQTEASTVIVEEELLPRLLSVLPKAASVKNVVVIPR